MPTTWWVTTALDVGGPVLLVSWVVWVIGSITLHELSHGWTAIRHGDTTPIETGHMTWNPLVHMGSTSLLMFAIVGIAWGLMPVNPARLRGRYGDAKVAAAGPMMNIALALASIVGGTVVLALVRGGMQHGQRAGPTLHNFFMFFMIGAALNIALALFNLVPVPPLDGWRILASLSPGFRRLFRTAGGGVASIIAMIFLFAVGGKYIFSAAIEASNWLIEHAARMVGLI